MPLKIRVRFAEVTYDLPNTLFTNGMLTYHLSRIRMVIWLTAVFSCLFYMCHLIWDKHGNLIPTIKGLHVHIPSDCRLSWSFHRYMWHSLWHCLQHYNLPLQFPETRHCYLMAASWRYASYSSNASHKGGGGGGGGVQSSHSRSIGFMAFAPSLWPTGVGCI